MQSTFSTRAFFAIEEKRTDVSRQHTAGSSVIFIHSYLDDYGLSAAVFRVFCHLARRAGRGAAFPAIASMARICRLHPQTVRMALRFLVQHGLITRQPRPGATTLYRLAPADQWQPPLNFNPSNSHTSLLVSEDTNPKPIQHHPLEKNVRKGYPIEKDNFKEHSHKPPQGKAVNNKKSISLLAEQIYAAYPKQVGKPAALRAIHRALAHHSSEFLLERTRLYAATFDCELRYVPHPATWFQDQRFNDDPSTWRRTGGNNGQSRPAIIRPDNFGCGVSKL